MKKRLESPEVAALRLSIAAVIAAILKAPDVAERDRLTKERNALGRQLAALLKASEHPC